MERTAPAISSTYASAGFAADDHEAGISDSDIENLEETTDLNNATPYVKTVKTINVKFLLSVAKITDRYGVSDIVAAAICSAALKDVDVTYVVDRPKMCRNRTKLCSELQQQKNIQGLHIFMARKTKV